MTEGSLDRLERRFHAVARTRGERYFLEGRVQLRRLDAAAIAAEVRGKHRYDASLRFDEKLGAWQLYCTCRSFADFGPCKHLWATIRAARAAVTSVEEPLRRPATPGRVPDSVTEVAKRILAPRIRRAFADPLDAETDEEDQDPSSGDSSDPTWTAGRELEPVPLAELRALAARAWPSRGDSDPPERRLHYVLALSRSPSGEDPRVIVSFQRRYKRGGWSDPKPYLIRGSEKAGDLPAEDRAIVSLLRGPEGQGRWSYGSSSSFAIPAALQAILLPRIATTGRLHLAVERGVESEPLAPDPGERWEFGLALSHAQGSGGLSIEGFLVRGSERIDVTRPVGILEGGFLVNGNLFGEVDWRGAWASASILRRAGRIDVPENQSRGTLDLVRRLPGNPRLEAPGILKEISGRPRPHLLLGAPEVFASGASEIGARIAFEYETEIVRWKDTRRIEREGDALVVVHRDEAAEGEAIERLGALGARIEGAPLADPDAWILPRDLPSIVSTLLTEGWRVEAEGKPCRSEGSLSLSIRSGIDWFDLEGKAEFGGASADLPDLLRAVEGGGGLVRLTDGSFGVLPEKWLAGWGLAGVSTRHGGSLRFQKSQAWLLDLLLAQRGDVDVDAAFAHARSALRRFERFEPAREPEGFRGELRAYQRDGLGWLALLSDLGLGGCLADDMGLGKTVQVLALLAGRSNGDRKPSLVVAPRSVVFNWLRETERFAPALSVLAHYGADRSREPEEIASRDLVVTTYGTLRRDAELLSRIRFSHAILDEAHAIKNPASQSAKAARLLVADHRLVLTGTPVENHLDDLWSIFEFLNPGMLGRSKVFREIVSPARRAQGEPGESTRLLSRALRPFLLRRTKEQVLTELPPKVEQVIACALEGAELRRYEELRDHYRAALLGRADELGMERIGIHVLEALLRLRQAACHPGLVDPLRTGESSAKLDALFPMLEEVRESGHKALVFSQFTSFLAIVRERLDAAGAVYEYLDGKTVDRAERVRRFQEDAACPLFLISLKAGGFGLNLTAADYVFLLDPWWNPAIERQAIDRTHRIGQTRTVNAYRLVASGTIEEKVLELQQKKRALAEAILGGTEGTLRDLTREDLERLLS